MEEFNITLGEYHEETLGFLRTVSSERLPRPTNSSDEASANSMRQELKRWCELSLALIIVLSVLQLSVFYPISAEFSMLPLILLEFKNILSEVISPKLAQAGEPPISLIEPLIYSTGNLIFYALVILYFNTHAFYFIIVGIPPTIASFAVILLPGTKSDNILPYSRIVITIQLFICTNCLKIVIFVNIGLKLDGLIAWPWPKVLWPIWSVLGALGVVGITVIMLACSIVCAYYYDSSNSSDLQLLLWLAYSVFGGVWSCTWMLISILKNSTRYPYVPALLFLIVFLVVTVAMQKILILSWKSLGNFNTEPEVRNTPAPRMVQTRIVRKVKIPLAPPPSSLIKISNTYFKPCIFEKSVETGTDAIGLDKSELNLENITLPKIDQSLSHAIILAEGNYELDNKCTICSEKECNGVLMECGHGGICSSCAKRLMKSKGTCHICRGDITRILKIEAEGEDVFKVVGVVNRE